VRLPSEVLGALVEGVHLAQEPATPAGALGLVLTGEHPTLTGIEILLKF
jgi:hypothetical protein